MASSLPTVSNDRGTSDVSVVVSVEKRTVAPFDVEKAISSQAFQDLRSVIKALVTACNSEPSRIQKRLLGTDFMHYADEVLARTEIATDAHETLDERGDCFQELRSYVGDFKDRMQALPTWPRGLPSSLKVDGAVS